MKLEKLIAMANQIGSFFEAMPDREQAVADVASHLKRSWEPRMRQQILASLGTADEARLKPLVHEALLLLRDAQA
ncbi:MAG: formate dehydrogenase subunit delta [Sulfuritalea sp.]|jgi:formate dehydrogenase subunit delta|nr:formate dehydrogenase subunit delta [Sulfuritalea sp.]MBK8761225.1 formate dehydrogenase subunit delta [Sulfuritalea sp.]MBK9349601.1 formate dehydrogenase subunit delta [Sulfuritalea sp.]MBP7423438.1 formate dehydrogenase subunit delta [Sulfuritalea sp.]